jgi:hypothetical protein
MKGITTVFKSAADKVETYCGSDLKVETVKQVGRTKMKEERQRGKKKRWRKNQQEVGVATSCCPS